MVGQRIKKIVFRHVKEYLSLYTFVTGLFLMGIIFGAIVVNSLSYGSKSDLLHYLQQFFGELSRGQIADPGRLFKESLLNGLQYVGLIFLLGLSVIGLPIIFLLVFVKGMILGFTVGFLVSQLGLHGFLASMVSVFPQNLLIMPNYLFLAVISVAFSLKIVRRLIVKNNRDPIFHQLIGYGIMFAGSVVVLAAASGYEAYISPALIRLFIP